eukprot:s3614_g3.t2
MGNGQVLRRAQEIYSDLSTNADRNYTKVCSLVPETPDRYRSHRRFDKFRVNRGATRPVWAVAIAEVNMMMAAATADHEIHLWDLDSMELKVSLKGHSDQVWEVKFSTNETTLASASSDKTLRLWDTQDGSPLGVLRGHTAAIRCLSFSYEGYLISGDQDANLFLWEAENAHPIKQWQAHEGCVHSVTFSLADPLMAISVGADGSVASWYVKRDEDDMVLGGRFPGGDGGAVLSLTAHPIYPGVDGDVWIWGFKPNFQEGNADVAGHTKLKGHSKAVWFLEFSRDACLLASASADCTVRVWNATNVQSPSLLSVFRAHDSWVRQVRWFTQPGKGLGRKRLLVTCSTDGSVSIWAPPGRLRKINKLQAAPNFGCKDVGCEAEVVQLPLVANEETRQPGSELPPAPLALPSSEQQLQPMPEETATPRDPREPRDAAPPPALPAAQAALPMPLETAMPREAPGPTPPTPPTPETKETKVPGTATKGAAVPVAPPSAVSAQGAALGPVREGVGSQPKQGPSPPSAGSANRGAALGPVSEGVGSQPKPGPSPPSAGSAPRGVASQPKAGPAPPSAGSAPRGVAIGPVSEGVGKSRMGSKGSKSLNSTLT